MYARNSAVAWLLGVERRYYEAFCEHCSERDTSSDQSRHSSVETLHPPRQDEKVEQIVKLRSDTLIDKLSLIFIFLTDAE